MTSPRILSHLFFHSLAALSVMTIWTYFNNMSSHHAHNFLKGLAILISLVTGIVLSHVLHEWGHFSGALLSRSSYTLKPKISPLFFDFDYAKNKPRQYLWMSVGGPLGNLLLIASILLLLPIDTIGERWLLATTLGQLMYVLVLEGPVSIGILRGKPPLEMLAKHFGQGRPLFIRSLIAGILSGLLSLWYLS